MVRLHIGSSPHALRRRHHSHRLSENRAYALGRFGAGDLERIGLGDVVHLELAEIHRAHGTTIAFENFDSQSGNPVSPDLAHIEEKWSPAGGAGTASSNLLLQAALKSIGGFDVEAWITSIRIRRPGGPAR
jgi:arylamine N-acetyltransferase